MSRSQDRGDVTRAVPSASAHDLGAHAPLALAAVVLVTLLVLAVRASLTAGGGALVYPLDDAYIHMAMARTLATHGTWGLHPGEFVNASSSPLWTLLLALADRVVGARDVTPLVLNVATAFVLVALVYRALRRRAVPASITALALVAVIACTPLPALTIAGQEHVLHALLSLAFLFALSPAGGQAPDARVLPLLAMPLAAVRYEGLFLCGMGALVLGWRGRRGLAAATLGCALLPPAAVAAVAVAHGGLPLPNPVLLKGGLPRLDSAWAVREFAIHWLRQLLSRPQVLALVVPALALMAARALAARRDGARLPTDASALVLFLGTALLHLQFARFGWFFRYEGYLIAIGVVAVAWSASAAWKERGMWPGRGARTAALAFVLVLLAGAIPLGARALAAQQGIARACRNIAEQQVPMGRFLKRWYPGASIAANDIGAISWLAGVDVLDLWGLASDDVARARRAATYDRATIERLARAHGCRIAVVYARWFEPGAYSGIPAGRTGGLPASWTPAGRWSISDVYVAGDSTVSFFAIQPAEAAPLRAHLAEFAPALPAGVRWRIDPDSTFGGDAR